MYTKSHDMRKNMVSERGGGADKKKKKKLALPPKQGLIYVNIVIFDKENTNI